MKTLFAWTALAAFILCAPAAIAADQPDTQHGDRQDQGKSQGQAKPETQAKPQSQPRPQPQARPQAQPRPQAQTALQRQPRNQPAQAPRAAPLNNAARPTAARGQAGGQTGGAHANVDIHSYQRNVTAQHHFQAGAYRAPQGYSYRRWSYGQSLPAIYFSQNYWLSDYGDYGLMAPPYGYVWVRFGPDALLIDQYTGQIVQVDYAMFY